MVGAVGRAAHGDRHGRVLHRSAGAACGDARPGAGTVAPLTMRYADFVRFTLASLAAHRLRSFLTALGIAVGIAAVILLTSIGDFLPDDDPRAARTLAVLGAKVARELFGGANPLGAHIHVGGERYRVVGVMESKGQVLGFDLDDTVYIPVSRALDMFNRESLMEIEVTYEPTAPLAEVEEGIKRVLTARHGAQDFTVTPQP